MTQTLAVLDDVLQVGEQDIGLEAAVRSLAGDVSTRTGLPVRVSGATHGRLPPAVETALYQLVREGLHNAVRHAGASQLHVHLSPGRGTIRCAVRDDGCGFDTDHARGLGLAGIRARIDAVGGFLRVQSQAGFGTEILASVPVGPEGAS